MANAYVQVATDGTGKKMQTFQNTISGNDVQSEAVTLVDSSGNYIATLPVSLASNINVNVSAGSNVGISTFTGAANMFNGQIAATTTPATLVAARATRRSVTIRNINTSISVYVGLATVSSSNGMLLRAGDSISVDYVGLIQVVAGSNSPNVSFLETYD